MSQLNPLNLKIPPALKPGSRIATVSLSSGSAGELLYRYEIGKAALQENFGVEVVEMPHTLKSAEFVRNNPQARAEDLMAALTDSSIDGIICCIGGDDTIRLLPHVDFDVIANNPKVFMGYSDTTVNHHMFLQAGVRSYYGPAILTQFAENQGMFDYVINNTQRALFQTDPIGELTASDAWTAEFLDWNNPENQNIACKRQPAMPWQYIQGDKAVQGHLLGGCLEALEHLKGTPLWLPKDMWQGAIYFTEMCEWGFPASFLEYHLRSLGAMGILQNLNGLLFARPGGSNNDPAKFGDYDEVIKRVLKEVGRDDMPVITRMDFGHTDPILTLPYGALAEIDPQQQTFRILEAGVAKAG